MKRPVQIQILLNIGQLVTVIETSWLDKPQQLAKVEKAITDKVAGEFRKVISDQRAALKKRGDH